MNHHLFFDPRNVMKMYLLEEFRKFLFYILYIKLSLSSANAYDPALYKKNIREDFVL